MLTIIENDPEGTVRVHASTCRDAHTESMGLYLVVTTGEYATREAVAECVADNQGIDVDELGEIRFLPCSGL